MNTRPAQRRRRIDADNPLHRLSTEERQAAFMIGLSTAVGTACHKWLEARGISTMPKPGEYPGRTVQSPPQGPHAQHGGTQQDDHTGGDYRKSTASR